MTCPTRRSSRSPATRRSSSPRTSSPTGIRRALAERERARGRRARARAGLHAGRRRRAPPSGSTSRRSADERRPRSSSSARARARARDARPRARAAGRRARRRREHAGLGAVRRSPPDGARARERAAAPARRERQPRHRGDERRVGALLEPGRRPGAGRGRRAHRLRRRHASAAGSPGRARVWPDGTLAADAPELPDGQRHDRPPDAAAAALPAARAPARRTTSSTRTSTSRVEADWLLGAFLLMRRADARRARRLGRGLPALRRGHRPLLPRDARRLGALVRPGGARDARLGAGDRPALPLTPHALARARAWRRFVRKHPETLARL